MMVGIHITHQWLGWSAEWPLLELVLFGMHLLIITGQVWAVKYLL